MAKRVWPARWITSATGPPQRACSRHARGRSLPRMSFLGDSSFDLLGRAPRIVGQGVALGPPEHGSGATRARSFAGRDQAGDRPAPIGDNHLSSRLGGSDQLRQPVFGLENSGPRPAESPAAGRRTFLLNRFQPRRSAMMCQWCEPGRRSCSCWLRVSRSKPASKPTSVAASQ
jgi:hypothetical protein